MKRKCVQVPLRFKYTSPVVVSVKWSSYKNFMWIETETDTVMRNLIWVTLERECDSLLSLLMCCH